MGQLLALQERDILVVAVKMKLTVGQMALLRRVIVQRQKRENHVSVCEWRVGT